MSLRVHRDRSFVAAAWARLASPSRVACFDLAFREKFVDAAVTAPSQGPEIAGLPIRGEAALEPLGESVLEDLDGLVDEMIPQEIAFELRRAAPGAEDPMLSLLCADRVDIVFTDGPSRRIEGCSKTIAANAAIAAQEEPVGRRRRREKLGERSDSSGVRMGP